MLTFEKVLEVFKDYLQQDPLYEAVYTNFMEDQMTDNERDLTEQENAEIKRQYDLLQAKCMRK